MLRRSLTILLLVALIPLLVLGKGNKKIENVKAAKTTGTLPELIKAVDYNPHPMFSKTATVAGDIIGYTYYDYMTNGGIGDRIALLPDGTVMVGTQACWTSDGGTSARGSYYQYYDGSKWFDTTSWRRIESARKGFTQFGVFASSKAAVVVTHAGLALNVNYGTAEVPAWTPQTIPNSSDLTWPVIAVDEGDGRLTDMYVTGGASATIPLDIIKSADLGSAWERMTLTDTLSDAWANAYIGANAEDYAVAASNKKVAVLNFVHSGNVTLYVSTDQGTTWSTKTLDDKYNFDLTLDAIPFDSSFFPAKTYKMLGIPYADGTGDVHIDKNGVVHAAWGSYELGYRILVDSIGNALRDTLGQLQRTFFTTDYAMTGIYYWNSNMTDPVSAVPVSSTMIDETLMALTSTGVPTTLNSGLDVSSAGMPCIGTDADGKIYMSFQSFKSGDKDSLEGGNYYPFGHVYLTGSVDGGAHWSVPTDLYEGTTKEDVLFPSIPDNIGSDIYVLVQNDNSPGTWLQQADHPFNRDLFIVKKVGANTIVSVEDKNVNANPTYDLKQNYPNPFNPATTINYSIAKSGIVTLKIYDVLGNEVKTLVNGVQNTGMHEVSFNAQNLSSGFYFYTITTDNFTSTKKMILLK
jgi:hypothetical protein